MSLQMIQAISSWTRDPIGHILAAQSVTILYKYYQEENQLVEVAKKALRDHIFGYNEEKAEALSMLLEIDSCWQLATDTSEKQRLHVLALAICYCLRVYYPQWHDFSSLVKFLRTVLDSY